MARRKLNPIITVLLCAFCAVIVTILVLYVFVGYRYINDSENGVKFIGMTNGGIAESGKLYYSDGTKGTLDAKTSTILLDNGEQYTGDLNGFIPNGQGILKKADGTVYEGTFLNGACSGEGRVVYHGGDVYEGALVNGEREGFGKYLSEDGASYVGGFENNLKHGAGYSISASGAVYIGNHKNSIKDGFGAYLFKNGDIYVGEFKNDKRTGRGIYIWAKSEEYASEFDEAFLNIEFNDAFVSAFNSYFETRFNDHFTDEKKAPEYTGELIPFWQTIETVLSRSQVEFYVGEFRDNLLEGYGKYIWLSGRCQTGQFENGNFLKEAEEAK